MSIRAFFHQWFTQVADPFSHGNLPPLAVSPHATDVQPNEDGTITLHVTFDYETYAAREEFAKTTNVYLEELKTKNGVVTVIIDRVE